MSSFFDIDCEFIRPGEEITEPFDFNIITLFAIFNATPERHPPIISKQS